MAGLLDTDAIQKIFGSALAGIYGDGELITVTMVRGPGGVQTPQETSVPCKVQVDNCDEAMRSAEGYSDTDVKLIILQDGMTGSEPDGDSIVIAQGKRWKVSGVRSDPARAAWVMRGIRQAAGS